MDIVFPLVPKITDEHFLKRVSKTEKKFYLYIEESPNIFIIIFF